MSKYGAACLRDVRSNVTLPAGESNLAVLALMKAGVAARFDELECEPQPTTAMAARANARLRIVIRPHYVSHGASSYSSTSPR